MAYTFPYFGHSVADAAREIYQGEDPWVAIGCFLNDWWSSEEDKQASLISDPLPPSITLEGKRWAAFCAATVEELCQRASLISPAWTNKQEYFLVEPWFYYPQLSQREWLLSTTPESYKRRNIFVGDNVLDNKYELKKIFGSKPKWTIWSNEELEKYPFVDNQ
jgi:hypothetical protein